MIGSATGAFQQHCNPCSYTLCQNVGKAEAEDIKGAL